MEWVVLGIFCAIVLGFGLFRLLKGEAKSKDDLAPSPHSNQSDKQSSSEISALDVLQSVRELQGVVAPAETREHPLLSATEVLAAIRALQKQAAQWPEIWAQLNPGGDPVLQQLLLELRNDGLQFSPSDGLRKMEVASETLAAGPRADAIGVVTKALGRTDLLDKFKS